MKIIPEIAAAQDEIRAIRHWMHAHPELGFEEAETGDLIAKTLAGWGIEIHRGLGRTGVVGVLRAGNGGRSIGLRADMDALPIEELNTFSHRSQNPGKMHACGHDGHMAMLLGAARYLSQTRDFNGTIVFIFSPAEEAGNGAKLMVDQGLFDFFPVDAVFGLHNFPGMPVGSFGIRPGSILGASCDLRIVVKGVDGHACYPHECKDPIFTAVQVYNALQGIITRNKPPLDPAVISLTQFQAGGIANNVVPAVATLGGTVRAMTVATLEMIGARLRTVVDNIAAAQDCATELHFDIECPPTVNTPDEVRFAANVMRSIVGDRNVNEDVEPDLGVEDFAFMLQARPGAYAYLGNGNGEHRGSGAGPGPCVVHNASFDFNDDILGIGSTYWAELARGWLRSNAGAENRLD
ncbi:M20 aminoacylase family protein [Mesorhizobium sp.]|uniref:M20 aminoacylase family protein n=1 Tax=Mesorhizobium sp. TaxID=1871066 RepID=UPI000FE60F0B|nr:M20 aminoacylase family protein [Mesorhizobium sp.]RWK28963.1 MAG: amidohydrolase [Mesorhizobium sp.]